MIAVPFSATVPPSQATIGSVAFDLRASISVAIPIGSTAMVPTGLKFALPNGYAGLVCSRSGLATKGIFVTNAPGIVDSDYRGEVNAIITNLGVKDYVIEKGDRSAQLLILGPHGLETDVHWVWNEKLEETRRGESGFGSTGK